MATDPQKPRDAMMRTPKDSSVLIRTALSGVTFGAIGALVGRTVGKWGDQGGRVTGQRFLMAVGGIGSALIAVYSSLKVARIDADAERDAQAPAGRTPEQQNTNAPQQPAAADAPATRIDVAAIAHEGNARQKDQAQLSA